VPADKDKLVRPHDPTEYDLSDIVKKVRAQTPARLLAGRSGAAYRTNTQLELREAHAFLSTATESNPALFSAPTPFLQGKFSTAEIPLAKKTIRTLYSHKDDLSPDTARRAALLGFAIEDYRTASSIADESLSRAPRDAGLLMARGLVEYGSGSYLSATLNFQEASKLTPKTEVDTDFLAALNTNLGLSIGQLGAVTHNQAEYGTALKHLQEATAQYENLGHQNQAAANNLSEAEILAAYPDLDAADIVEALLYAADAVREREPPLVLP